MERWRPQVATPFRPTGSTGAGAALASIVDELGWLLGLTTSAEMNVVDAGGACAANVAWMSMRFHGSQVMKTPGPYALATQLQINFNSMSMAKCSLRCGRLTVPESK